MTITYVFINGTSKLHLQPQGARDEKYNSLFADGKPNLSLEVGKDGSITITAKQEVSSET